MFKISRADYKSGYGKNYDAATNEINDTNAWTSGIAAKKEACDEAEYANNADNCGVGGEMGNVGIETPNGCGLKMLKHVLSLLM